MFPIRVQQPDHVRHCGCAMVGEIKQGRYIYYHHHTGYKGKCSAPDTREEVLEEKFTSLLN